MDVENNEDFVPRAFKSNDKKLFKKIKKAKLTNVEVLGMVDSKLLQFIIYSLHDSKEISMEIESRVLIQIIFEKFKSYQIQTLITENLEENEKPIEFKRECSFFIPDSFLNYPDAPSFLKKSPQENERQYRKR